MKRKLILIIALSVFLLTSVTASARGWHNDNDDRHDRHYNHQYSHHGSWRSTHHNDYEAERYLPFRWHDHYSVIRERHHMERIYSSDWDDRFPGLFAHRWHGEGFWHHGHYVTDAVFFFNSDNRLVSIGYMHDGVFIHFREDHESYESRDSFFIGWWRH